MNAQTQTAAEAQPDPQSADTAATAAPEQVTAASEPETETAEAEIVEEVVVQTGDGEKIEYQPAEADEAQVVDVETVLTVPEGTVLWEEMQMSEGGPSRVIPVMKDAAGRLGDLDAWMGPSQIAAAELPDEVGSRIRWWDRRPSDERRALTPWDSE